MFLFGSLDSAHYIIVCKATNNTVWPTQLLLFNHSWVHIYLCRFAGFCGIITLTKESATELGLSEVSAAWLEYCVSSGTFLDCVGGNTIIRDER